MSRARVVLACVVFPLGFLIVTALGALSSECSVLVRPGESVQLAIDAAPSGAVVCLGEGIWRENLVITKPITLRGAGGSRTTIKGFAADAPVIRVSASNAETWDVVLSNLVVTNGHGIQGHGIRVEGAARVRVEEVSVEGNDLFGIWVGEFSEVTVLSSTVRDNFGGGVWAGDSSRVSVINCTIAENHGNGVVVAGSAEAFVSQSQITGNAEYGIILHDRECIGEGIPFTGYVIGRKNLVPWPGLRDGNGRGSVCPDGLGFLLTEAGGSLDRRLDPGETPVPGRGMRFVIQAQGVEEMVPGRRRETVDQLIKVITDRLHQYGFPSAELRPLGHDGIEILVPGVTDPDRVRLLISQRSILGFYKVLDASCSEADLRGADVGGRVLPARDSTEWYLVESYPLFTGEAVETAFLRVSPDPRRPGYDIALRLTPGGADIFVRVLGQLAEGDRLAIVVDDVVYSAPIVSGSILLAAQRGWRAVRDTVTITGRFTMSEAQQLVVVLRSGALPVGVVLVEESRY